MRGVCTNQFNYRQWIRLNGNIIEACLGWRGLAPQFPKAEEIKPGAEARFGDSKISPTTPDIWRADAIQKDMTGLVQAVTTEVDVAEAFGKRHAAVAPDKVRWRKPGHVWVIAQHLTRCNF